MKNFSQKLRILYVSNKTLPTGDYRLLYGQCKEDCDIIYALPDKPEDLAEDRYVKMGFREGLSVKDAFLFFHFFAYLYKNRKRFDLAHFYSTKLILFGPIICRFLRIPSLITLTGLGRIFYDNRFIYRKLRKPYLLCIRISMALTQVVLFQNRGDLQFFSDTFPSQRYRFYYIGSAMDFPLARNKDYSAVKLTVFLVSRLLESKGILDFLKVAERLQGDFFDFVLVGPPSKGCETLSDKVQLCHSKGIITYKMELYGEPLINEYHRSHIFYFPSKYGEGLPRVLLEAGFSGLCPIAYDIPANHDLIGPGRGFIVPTGAIDEVTRILMELYRDRKRLESEAFEYQLFIQGHYIGDVFIKRMDDILFMLRQKL